MLLSQSLDASRLQSVARRSSEQKLVKLSMRVFLAKTHLPRICKRNVEILLADSTSFRRKTQNNHERPSYYAASEYKLVENVILRLLLITHCDAMATYLYKLY